MAGVYRKYTRELLTEAVEHSTSVAGVLRHLGLSQAGGTHAHISRTIRSFGLDTTHFVRWQGGGQLHRLPAEAILVHNPHRPGRAKPHLLLRALLEVGRRYECAACGIGGLWQGRPLRLHVDHVNGDFRDNRATNLRFLCPNCLSQTANFAGRSRGSDQARVALAGPKSPGRGH